MQNLKIWEEKIKEERKKTTFKNYIKNIVSRQPLIFNQNNKEISRFPETNRIKTINLKTFEETRDNLTKN
jgi:hypothetical protein